MALHALVLAGGSGTRLWPLSRGGTPKHLLPLGPGGVTLLRATLERLSGVGDDIHVVTAAAQAEQCGSELAAAGLDGAAVIAEPEARGTGPALGLATAVLARSDPEALILSVHADHRVADAAAYREAVVASAGWAAATQGMATVGLTPAYASTGMGYVAKGSRLDAGRWRALPELVQSSAPRRGNSQPSRPKASARSRHSRWRTSTCAAGATSGTSACSPGRRPSSSTNSALRTGR